MSSESRRCEGSQRYGFCLCGAVVPGRDGGGLSEPPEKSHPWSNYYSERGVTRPAKANLSRKPEPPATAAGVKPADAAPEMRPVSDELAAAVEAATAEMPGTTAAPFIGIMQREALARELRRQARVRWMIRGAIAAAVVVVFHFAITRFFYRAPSESALQAYADALTHAVVPLHSTSLQPLVPAGTVVTMTDHVSTNRIRYAAEVGLRLSQPLYIPAVSNGTAAYRQMQQSLQYARERDLKFKIFEGKDGPAPPEMPMLIQVAHRAGERVTVRVPFEARRFGWHWRIEPAMLALRSTDRSFDGATIQRFVRSPYLVFGAPGTMGDMRRRIQLARAYIIALTKEVQKRADAEAIESPLDPAIAFMTAADPDAPAVAVDPDAAAVDPDAPAVDPNAPAVPRK